MSFKKIDEVIQLINGKKGKDVALIVKKKNGLISTINFKRDKLIFEEHFAKSVILNKTKSSNKIGLIELKSFYADFSNPKGRRASEDIKIEIQKLMDADVSCIILDLRQPLKTKRSKKDKILFG